MNKLVPALLLAAVLLGAGCSRPAAPVVPPPEANTPQPREAPLPVVSTPTPTPGVDVFPTVDTAIRFSILDAGALTATQVTEYLLRAGDRVIAGYGGRAYATRFIRNTGVWRADPHNSGSLLRYLPPQPGSAAWKQRSGDADVWFRLQTANFTCQHWQLRIANRECWELTVLNRGERSDFFFLEGTGPVKAQVTNWAKPQASFVKQAQAVETALPAGAERAAYLPGGLASPPPEAPFTVVTFSDFDQALVAAVRAAGRPITELDLDGDGAKELVLGPLGQWTTEPVEFIRTGAGSPLPPLANWATSARHRVTPYPVDGGKKTWFLHERHLPELGHSLITLEQGGFMEVWGWAPKASRTEGTEVSFRPDGTIVVVWDMGDPARHRWIREYKLDTTRDDWPYLQSVSSRFVPQEGELRYPATPQEVLQAAFVAFWLGFDDELPRYFAAPNVAEPLTTNTKAERAMYGPGTVELGTVTFKEITGFGADPVQRPEITPSPVGPDGTVGFLARLGGYEHTNYVWGKVTFGIDPAGRPVIVRLEVEGAVSLF